MVNKNLEYARFDTLKDLYDKILTIEFLKDKVQLYDGKIEIIFHDYLVLTIKLKNYFCIYFNSILHCKEIEDQDIWEVIYSFLDESKVYIEHYGFKGKQKIKELTREQFERKKGEYKNMTNVKIYSIKELIYQS